MGKVWTPGGGTKGYVPEEHPLSPPSLVLGRQCLFVECSASASMDLAFWLRVLLRPWCLQRHGATGRASYAMVVCALWGRLCVELLIPLRNWPADLAGWLCLLHCLL